MIEYGILFVLGSVLGSFYNVVIYRLPKRISLIRPSSHCPNCGNPIRWYDNIPILSYFFLKGKCRYCGSKISFQYPLVEILTGVLAVLSYYLWGASLEALVMFFYFSALLVLSVIDFKLFILPDEITLPLIPLGIAISFFRDSIDPAESLLGAFVGFSIPLIIYLYYVKIRGMEGLGFGDVKLLSGIGSFTGVGGVLGALFLGSFIGLLFVLPVLIKNRSLQFAIPFGPFLALGNFLWVIFKDSFLSFLGLP